MDINPVMLSAGSLTTFVLEAIKYLWRARIAKDPDYDFPPLFYEIGVPFLTFLMQIVLGFAGWAPMPEFTVAYLAQWFLGVLVAFATYALTLKPLKEYRATVS